MIMAEQSPFVALRCQVCGGKLDVPEPNVIEGADGIFSIIGNSPFSCQFCDTEYLPQQSLERFTGGGQVVISGIDGGSAVIGNIITGYVGGDIIAGDKIGGDKIVMISEPTPPQVELRQPELAGQEKSKPKLIPALIWRMIKPQNPRG